MTHKNAYSVLIEQQANGVEEMIQTYRVVACNDSTYHINELYDLFGQFLFINGNPSTLHSVSRRSHRL